MLRMLKKFFKCVREFVNERNVVPSITHGNHIHYQRGITFYRVKMPHYLF